MATQDDRVVPGRGDPEATFDDLLSVAELLNEPELARLYSFVLRQGPVTIDAVKPDLELPTRRRTSTSAGWRNLMC